MGVRATYMFDEKCHVFEYSLVGEWGLGGGPGGGWLEGGVKPRSGADQAFWSWCQKIIYLMQHILSCKSIIKSLICNEIRVV